MYTTISFTLDMVRAMLRGDKWNTRRVIKPQPPAGCLFFPYGDGILWGADANDTLKTFYCPYARKLKVLEMCRIAEREDATQTVRGVYLVDGAEFEVRLDDPQWELFINRKRPFAPTPGRFMYRTLSRITIKRKDALGQRLSSITDEDALAEGVSRNLDFPPRQTFMTLWDVINAKKYPAKSDPLVWAMPFGWEYNES